MRSGDFTAGRAGVLSLALLAASFTGGDDTGGRADDDSGAPLLASLAGATQSAGACSARACGGGHSSVRAGCGAGVAACVLDFSA